MVIDIMIKVKYNKNNPAGFGIVWEIMLQQKMR